MRELVPRTEGLPPALTSFVGRRGELGAIGGWLTDGARLVTLLGPAGAGKTRLAIEWARRSPDDTVFCDLTEARTVDGVCFAVAAALGVPIARGKTSEDIAEQLVAALEARGRCLVVLDNFEQVLAHAPVTVAHWLRRAPAVQFLVTSRAPLGLAGEVVCAVGPLSLPAGATAGLAALGVPLDANGSEAVALFLERARAVRQGYEPGAGELEAIAAIALRLDGMPLAIELAAARMRVLGPRQIAAHLARRFELLRSSGSDRPARQATLRAAIDWSWELLEPIEKSALAQCAVFHGGFDLEAAQAVLSLGDGWALDVVTALCQRSLVQAYDPPDGDGEMRYRLYESVREYAAEKLAEAGQLAAKTEQRHDAYYEQLARDVLDACDGRPGTTGTRAARAALRTLGWELENLLAVHARAVRLDQDAPAAARALTIAVALEPLTLARGPLRLGLDLLDPALARSAALDHPDAALAARAALARGHVLAELGDAVESLAAREQAQVLALRAGDPRLEGRVRASLARQAWHAGEAERAARLGEAALVLHRHSGDRVMEGRTLSYRASALHAQGALVEARHDYEQALMILREVADRQSEAVTLGCLARLDHDAGALDRAEERGSRAVALLAGIGDRYNEASFLAQLGNVALERGELTLACDRLERAIAIHRQVGHRRAEAQALSWLGRAHESEGPIDEADRCYRRAEELLREHPQPQLEGLLACWRARLAADRDDLIEAEVLLDEGERTLARAGATLHAAVPLVCRAHIELARARQCGLEGDDDRAEDHLERAAQAFADDGGSSEVRLAARALRRAIDGHRGAPRSLTVLPPAPEVEGRLMISATARAFRVPRGESVDLSTRGPLRRILAALADLRQQAPGEALSRDALVEAGWPGERLGAEAAANRVYAAVATLRRMGLRRFLQRRDDGYLLDPKLPLERGEPI